MIVNPNSTIYLYSGIPLDNTYQDTLYFANRTDQQAYFNSLTPVKTFTYNMYQRVNSGVFRAQCVADDIYNVNYMRFQNTAYGNKWFYAFVNKVEYDNNGMALVEYEIDSIQTYLLDCSIKQCFIERQHSSTDQIGDNILPEPVSCGEYSFDDYQELLTGIGSNHIIIVAVCDVGGSTDGILIDGVYSGAKLYAFPASASALPTINSFIDSYSARPESIISIYMCPRWCLSGTSALPTNEPTPVYNTQIGNNQNVNVGSSLNLGVTNFNSFDGYQPRNKKLFTYPYNYLHVDNGNGDSMSLRYEFFHNPSNPIINVEGSLTNPIQVKCKPFEYKTNNIFRGINTEFLSVASYPLCSWNYDAYRAWVAQNSVPITLTAGATAAGALLTLGVGLATGGIGLIAAGTIAGVGLTAKLISQDYQASIQSDICHGNISSGNVQFSHNHSTFYIARAHIKLDYARMIDKFFDKYGYAFNKIARPALHVRERWTYVKTIDCKLVGACPSNEIKKICEKFNEGITFWVNADDVGNYSLQNRCLSEIS